MGVISEGGEKILRPEKLHDKNVIDSKAQIVGDAAGIEIDVSGWKVTHLCINLSDDAIEALGYKKPFIGKVLIDVPIDTIEKVSDVIVLKQSLAEIKNQIERHN
jgi:sporulation protein YlmC with PRC-barrel domain